MDAEHHDQLVQMMEIANCDEEIAGQYLRGANFDVEVAIRRLFDGDTPEGHNEVAQELEELLEDPEEFDRHTPVQAEMEDRTVRQPRGEVVTGYYPLAHFLADLLLFPVHLPLMVISLVFKWLFGINKTVPYTNMHNYIETHHAEKSEKKTAFYGRDFQSLRQDCQTNGWKYIVIYIHQHKGSSTFFNHLLDTDISEQIAAKDGVLFGSLADTEEAKRFRTSSPFGQRSFVLIYQITNTSLKKIDEIDELDSPTSVDRIIIQRLDSMIAQEARQQAERHAIAESRQLMQMQNQEYQQSLQKDLERIARVKKEKEEAEQLEREREEQVRLTEERIQTIKNYRNDLIEKNEVSQGKYDLQIRFRNGKKIIKFNPDDKLIKIFDEAIQDDKCSAYVQMQLSFPKRPISCLPKWYFDILEAENQEPKQECLDQGQTFEDAQITHGSLIYVENL